MELEREEGEIDWGLHTAEAEEGTIVSCRALASPRRPEGVATPRAGRHWYYGDGYSHRRGPAATVRHRIGVRPPWSMGVRQLQHHIERERERERETESHARQGGDGGGSDLDGSTVPMRRHPGGRPPRGRERNTGEDWKRVCAAAASDLEIGRDFWKVLERAWKVQASSR